MYRMPAGTSTDQLSPAVRTESGLRMEDFLFFISSRIIIDSTASAAPRMMCANKTASLMSLPESFYPHVYKYYPVSKLVAISMVCRVVESSHIIGKKWSIPVIEEIAFGKFDGFNKFLVRTKDITPRTLSLQLKELEHLGVIAKQNSPDSQNTATYALTKKGLELHRIIIEIKKWNVRWDAVSEQCLKNTCAECRK